MKGKRKSVLKEYNHHFVAKILKGDVDLKSGKGVKVDIHNLWK